MLKTTLASAHAAPHPIRPAPQTPLRDDSLDIAKGFGILLVVLGHCLDGLIASAYFPPALAWPAQVVYVIYLFHMPLFFLISGHLASGKRRPAGVTVARMMPTIVYPYFLWSIAEGLVLVFFSRYTTSHVPISALYKILWIPIIPYWFLYALFLCHLGYLAVRSLSHLRQLAIAAAAFLLPLLFLAPLNRIHLNLIPETTRGFLYFILGVIFVAQVKGMQGAVARWTAIGASALFALCAVLYWRAQFDWHGPVAESLGALAALPAGVCGIAATLACARLLSARRGRVARSLAATLAFWGRYSMSIYVLHIFVTAAVRIALKRFAAHPGPSFTALEILAATLLGVLLPLGFNWLVSRARLDGWFGLQHMQAASQS